MKKLRNETKLTIWQGLCFSAACIIAIVCYGWRLIPILILFGWANNIGIIKSLTNKKETKENE